MKKCLFFAAFMLAVFCVSANAAPCVADGNKIFCQWSATGCWQVNSTGQDASGNPMQSTCAEQAGYCPALYSGGTEGAKSCTELGNTPFTCTGCNWTEEGGLVWCDYGGPSAYGDGGCYQKTEAECLATTGTVVVNCPSSPPSPPSSSSISVTTPSSSSNGGTDPIISYNGTSVMGLNVTHFARSLMIASGKDATVALFDMHGKQVFSQRVFSGTTTLSLEKQKQGIYYAVVKSGSQKQTVKVILK